MFTSRNSPGCAIMTFAAFCVYVILHFKKSEKITVMSTKRPTKKLHALPHGDTKVTVNRLESPCKSSSDQLRCASTQANVKPKQNYSKQVGCSCHSPPASAWHRAELERVAIHFSRDLPGPGIKPVYAVDSLPLLHQGSSY